ncbi:DMT family transporter [Catenovulum sediminis]|uniref:DMT family transporter n=1 Tax=Catenovulum sediminis TaxID=1740262 RepID=UPI00117D7F48|nr:DMT family transporter [Catenovulum sediminis]
MLKHHLQVLLATVLVAGSFISAEFLAPYSNPIALTLLRFILAAALLAPFALYKKEDRAQFIKTLPRASIISLFYSLFFILMFEALKTTSSLNVSTLYTLIPFITGLLCICVFKQKMTLQVSAIYLMGALATCWVVFQGDIQLIKSFRLNTGDILFLQACLSMCCYSMAMKLLYRNDNKWLLVFCTLLSGAIWMFVALMIMGKPLDWQQLDLPAYYHMAYLVIGTTIVTVYLYQTATVALGPKKVMAYVYLSPAIVAGLGYLINDVSLNPIIIPGILISCTATLLLQKNAS